jgi:hypothetical protein
MTPEDVVTMSQRLEGLREARRLFAESGQMSLDALAADDAEQVAQAARTAAANELARLFEQARDFLDDALNAR